MFYQVEGGNLTCIKKDLPWNARTSRRVSSEILMGGECCFWSSTIGAEKEA